MLFKILFLLFLQLIGSAKMEIVNHNSKQYIYMYIHIYIYTGKADLWCPSNLGKVKRERRYRGERCNCKVRLCK